MGKFFCLLTLFFSIARLSAGEPFKIFLNYQFDNGYFSDHPERQIPLEYAAHLWEQVLSSEMSVPAGTVVNLRSDYTKPGRVDAEFDEEFPGFVIFIYAYDFAEEVTVDGEPDPSTSKAFGGNWGAGEAYGYLAFNTAASRPWFFDTTPETEYDVPVTGSYDLITSAVHEMGHVLGILRYRQGPFVESFGERDERFNGEAARRVNGGEPIPLEYDSSHIRGSWWNSEYLPVPPIDRHVMHTYDPVQGYRQVMTAIDLAMMEDMGWEVDYSALPVYPYTPDPDPRKDDLERNFGLNEELLSPVGLWLFDRPEYVEDALIGLPLRYSPPKGDTGGLPDLASNGGIEVPRGGWLYCVTRLNPTSGGSYCNDYTLVLDLKIPAHGRYYTLFNTHPFSSNDGDTFINPSGYLGATTGGYSSRKVPVDKWVRVAVVINGDKGIRSYYMDGEWSHNVSDVSIDGRFSLYPEGSDDPFFCLFGDNDGEDNPFSVKGIILYDRALDSQQLEQLGTAANNTFLGVNY